MPKEVVKIDSNVTRVYDLYESVLEETEQECIQEFLKKFAEHFKINWERENTLTISTKNKKGVNYLYFKFKSKSVEKVNADQLNLFVVPKDENVLELEEV